MQIFLQSHFLQQRITVATDNEAFWTVFIFNSGILKMTIDFIDKWKNKLASVPSGCCDLITQLKVSEYQMSSTLGIY